MCFELLRPIGNARFEVGQRTNLSTKRLIEISHSTYQMMIGRQPPHVTNCCGVPPHWTVAMQNMLIRKLEQFAPLSPIDRRLLEDIVAPVRHVPARTDLIVEGQSSDYVRLIIEGIAFRYKHLNNGKRQIIGYLLPGDLCDLYVHLLQSIDHSIATMSVCKVVDIPRYRVQEMIDRPAIAKALWWVTLVDEGTLREWLLNVGQRPALLRIAHLFCELYIRMRSVGLASDGRFNLPLIQQDIADTTGLSNVHVNRCLQQLRDMNLVQINQKIVIIDSCDTLMQFCGFRTNYLHLGSYVNAQ